MLDLPVLIVAGRGPAELAAAVTALAEDLADALVEGRSQPPATPSGPHRRRYRWRTGRWPC
jgi:hypothetical protein